MSFPKAKIQRFNEIKDCTPSPAKYNVASQEKIKLGIISKSGKYAKKVESPPASEGGSVQSTPCFPTPTMPLKRKKILGMSFRGKSELKLTGQEELREKIVECNNKDFYIKELTEQIEEMTGKLNSIKEEYKQLKSEKNECQEALNALQTKTKEDSLKRAKDYRGMKSNLEGASQELKKIRLKHEDLKCQNFVEMSKLLDCVDKFKSLYDETVATSHEEQVKKLEAMKKEFEEREEMMRREHVDGCETLKVYYGEKLQNLEKKNEERLKQEIESFEKKLEESNAKIRLLQENLDDVNALTEMQMKEKIEEIEVTWKQKLGEKEKESEAILKECQEISEYNIIQSEIEKNQLKQQLTEKEAIFKDLEAKIKQQEEEISILKTEKHAYHLSIVTFQDTIEVLKKRLFNSDRDVEQLKEELEKSEEKILLYERKCTELTNQLHETETANEELEMQYESTSKLMQNHVKTIESGLVTKVDTLIEEAKKLKKDNDMLKTMIDEQQEVIAKAGQTVTQSTSAIEDLEKKQLELQIELKSYKTKLEEESEDAAEIRKKYIEKSGKYDELAHQFEQILQELDKAKGRINELEHLIGPYQEQLEAYQSELKLLNVEKDTIATEARELGLKYAEVIGHHNHKQKIKHLQDLKVKSSELFQKNIDLEAKNYKLNKTVEKLLKEVEDLRKSKKMKIVVDNKENFGSPKCVKVVLSPGPLKDKN